jgi:hypothetical protein
MPDSQRAAIIIFLCILVILLGMAAYGYFTGAWDTLN